MTQTPQPAPAPRANRSCLWGLLGAFGCLAILIAFVVIAAASGVTAVNEVIAAVREQIDPSTATPTPLPTATPTGTFIPTATSTAPPTLTPTPSPTPDYTQSIVQSVQLLGQLVSISWQVADAEINVGVRQGVLDACSFSNQHVAEGTVEAGIDLAAFGASDVQYDPATDTYTITLPAPQLTSCRVDYIRQYAGSTTLCGVDRDAARVLASYIAVNGFRADALEGGILTRAQQQAALVMANFVRAITGSGANIQFRTEAPPLPESCQPNPPEGWVYNGTDDVWTRPE